MISILAPTRGATIDKRQCGTRIYLFQSSLPQGERQNLQPDTSSPGKFQSSLPQGERRESLDDILASYPFQSSLPQGERQDQAAAFAVQMRFQSSLPQGERLCPGSAAGDTPHFNPRSHKGSDYRNHSVSQCHNTFQSTLPQGERLCLFLIKSFMQIFQSTLPQGERPKRVTPVN